MNVYNCLCGFSAQSYYIDVHIYTNVHDKLSSIYIQNCIYMLYNIIICTVCSDIYTVLYT